MRPLQADRRGILAGVGAEFLQGGQALLGERIGLGVEPAERVADASVALVVDVTVGEDVQSRRQGADTEPVAAMKDDGPLAVGDEEVAAGVVALVKFAGRVLDGGGGGWVREGFTSEQAAAAGRRGDVVFCGGW